MNIIFEGSNLEALRRVTIYDKHGNVKEVVRAEFDWERDDSKGRKKFGERPCVVCQKIFSRGRPNQKSCQECIDIRPMVGVSFRKTSLKEQLKRGES